MPTYTFTHHFWLAEGLFEQTNNLLSRAAMLFLRMHVHDQLMLHASMNGVVYENIVAIDFSVFLEIIPPHLASLPPL